MGVAAVVVGDGAGLLVGVWIGRSTLRRASGMDARRNTERTSSCSSEQTQASAEARRRSAIRSSARCRTACSCSTADGERRSRTAHRATSRGAPRSPRPGLPSQPPRRRSSAPPRPSGSRSPRSRPVHPRAGSRVTATPTGTDGSVLAVIADVTEARRLDAIRRDFVANASHELKTPAASIQAAAETLLHVWQDDPDGGAPVRRAARTERPCGSRGSSPTCSICRGWNRAASSRTACIWTRWSGRRRRGSKVRRTNAGLDDGRRGRPACRRSEARRATSRC